MNSDRAERLQENLFLTAYIMWMLYGVLHITLWRNFEIVSTVYEYFRKTAFALLFVRFLLKKNYTKRDVAGIFLLILACIFALHSVYNKQLIPVAAFACCAVDVDYRKILKWTLILQAAVMVVTITASQAGVIEDTVWEQWSAEAAAMRQRHALGYYYCGYPAHLLLFMTLIWMSIRKRFTIPEAILCVALNYAVYRATDSRADFYLAVLAVVGVFVWARPYRVKFIVFVRNFITRFGLLFAAAGSIALQFFYAPEKLWMFDLNIRLSSRLALGKAAIWQYGFTPLGSEIRWFGQGSVKADPSRMYNYVDNAFLKEALSYGVLFLLIVAVLYYFVGRQIARTGNHVIGWAMLITFAYALLNAHLFVLEFNVFALLPGMLFGPTKEEPSKSLAESMAKLRLQKMPFALRRVLRAAVMTLILGYVVLIQMYGTDYLVNYALMHAWVISGALFLLAILCNGEDTGTSADMGEGAGIYVGIYPERKDFSWLSVTVLLFFAVAFLSDFLVTKKFRYSAFCAAAFGGILVQSWRRMRDPEQLLQEFRWAYKLIFAVILAGCAVLQPAVTGSCYAGIFSDAEYLGIAGLIAFVVFLSDCGTAKGAVLNGPGAIVACYLMWLTQRPETAISAILIFAFWLCFVIRRQVAERSAGRDIRQMGRAVLCAGTSIGLGIAFVYAVCMCLYRYSPFVGTEVSAVLFPGIRFGNPEPVGMPLAEALRSGAWIDGIRTQLELAKEYLLRMNLKGNRYLVKVAGEACWPRNSIIMNTYRYGMPAGLACIAGIVLYLRRAIRYEFRRKNFFPAGLAFACFLIMMTETADMPFVRMSWLATGLSLGWMLL